MPIRFFRNLLASLILGFLIFFALPSDVRAESCSISGGPFYSVGNTITINATDYADQSLPANTYAIEIINQDTGQRIRLREFNPYLTFFPLNIAIPSVPNGMYNVELVALLFTGGWVCSNGPIAIGIFPPIVLDLKMDGGDGPLDVSSGTPHTLSWNSQWASSCNASGAWSGTFPTIGTHLVVVNSSGTYTMVCSSFGAQGSDSVSVTLTSVPPPPPPPLPPPPPSTGPPIPPCTDSGTTCIGSNGTFNDGCFAGQFQNFFCIADGSCSASVTPCPGGETCPSGGSMCTSYPSPSYPSPSYPSPTYPSPSYPSPSGGGGSSCSISNNPARISDLVCVVERIISILAPVAGIAVLAMILMGSFRFIKSAGDPKKVANARDTLKYAAFGAILVVAAWLILKVIQTVTGVNVTTVQFPTS